MMTMRMYFASPFRIGSGRPGRGLDEVVDRAEVLRGDSIKGILRAEARWLLPWRDQGDHPFVEAVFGAVRKPSPWNFEVTPVGDPEYFERASIRLDDRRRVVEGTLHVKEEVALHEAKLTVRLHRRLTGAGLPKGLDLSPRDCHEALIHLSARAAEKVGQRRTRGMGWVGFVSDRDADADLKLVWAIRTADGELA